MSSWARAISRWCVVYVAAVLSVVPQHVVVRVVCLQAIKQPGGRMRISPYSTETTFPLTKHTTGGFGLGMMESPVTGMMTVNRIAPGGVAEAAGIKEGFVLMKLGGHDLLQGAKSLQAAQQAIQPCAEFLQNPLGQVSGPDSDTVFSSGAGCFQGQ